MSNGNYQKIYFIFVYLFLVATLSSCRWSKCQTIGKITYKPAYEYDVETSSAIIPYYYNVQFGWKLSQKEIENAHPFSIYSAMRLIVSTSYGQSFVNRAKLIDNNLVALKPIDIFNNFAFSLDKSNIFTIYYYHNDLNTADEIVNTLMKESIKADIILVENIAKRDAELVKRLLRKIDIKANFSASKEDNIDIKVVNYYKENADIYQQLIKKNQVN